jgi:RHS repeat-associated protein
LDKCKAISPKKKFRFKNKLISMDSTTPVPVSDKTPHDMRMCAPDPVFGLLSDGSFQRRYTKEIKLDTSGVDTTEWTRTLTDGPGRTYKMLNSDSSFTQSFFNNQGQLVNQRDPDGVFTLSGYNSRGQVEYGALDLNTNGVIDFAGTDRITRTVADVVSDANLGVNVTRTRVYAWTTNSSAISNLLASTETSVDGLHTWQITFRDSATSLTNRTDTVYGGGGFRSQTNTAPDGSYTVSQYQFGRVVSSIRYDSGGGQLSSMSYSYDGQGRQAAVTDARNGATVYGYNSADLVTTITTPQPGGGQSAQTTTTYYNSRLQVSSVVAPDGGTTTYEYYPSGELKRTYGARTYPVGYSYDYAGRPKTMTNWTSFNSGAGARVTTWNYDTNRGWLNSKRYDNNQGPDYAYTAGGRLRTRTWARIGTSSTRISTTYTYGFNNATANDEHGDLLTVTYANDPQSTPSVTYSYDRRGRNATVARNSITTTLAYNNANQLLSQTNSGGTLNSWWVANTYDSLMRRTNLQAKAGSTVNANFSYGYDNASRLQTVTDGTNNGIYSYIANSPLVSQITFRSNTLTRMTTSKSYDFLNRLTQISSAPSGAAPLSFNYTYNDANQRIQVRLADASFWLYEYDSLGQVTSGKKYWQDWTPVAGQQFEYTQDDIGNRSQTKAGGDQAGGNLRLATYSVNNLNQYTNRTVPGAVDVMGVGNAAATVTVNNQATYRHGEFYRKELSIGNSSAPQWQAVTNKAVQGSTTNTVTGNVFLPKTPETFLYDADGNLISDGRWTNNWDAENRLITMKGLSTLPTAANLQLQFEYDWQGRRIRKQVSTWNGHSYTLSTDTKAIWDGWNCIVEPNGSDVVQRRYMWGLDLSGTEQGAGGVGGLLAVKDVSGGTGVHFPTFDGNGNVASLVKATDGTFSANYEYGPFGEVIRASGSLAHVNPVRFSTKYQDDETDLLYYGYRSYNPGTGKWLSRDLIGELAGFNLYCYARNAPLEFGDRDGLQLVDTIVKIGTDAGETTWRIGPGETTTGTYPAPPAGASTTLVPRGPGVLPPVVLTPNPDLGNLPREQPTQRPPATATDDNLPAEAYLYRAMRADAGGVGPMTGRENAMLGAVRDVDVKVDIFGVVSPTKTNGRYQGMSVNPNRPNNIFYKYRPVQLIGPIPKQPDGPGLGNLPVWKIRPIDLGAFLDYHADPPGSLTHGVVHPKFCMKYEDYQRELESTKVWWKPVDLTRFMQ